MPESHQEPAHSHYEREEAKKRLDTLIKKSRADLYKPIAIAEILFRHRTLDLDITEIESYRRKSYEWMREIIRRLHNKTTELNSRYWDQTFDPNVLPPNILIVLAEWNKVEKGVVETYIYSHIRSKFTAFRDLRQKLELAQPQDFSLETFLGFFEKNAKYRGSVDKAYEIVVYALFNAIVDELQATVTLSIHEDAIPILKDFEDFARLVLGIDSQNLRIEQPARLFRVGTANANDAGLDMWANFGPAVQVKHVSLKPSQVGTICAGVRADQIIIVCKKREAQTIQSVVAQLGGVANLRGIITDQDLHIWYDACFVLKYRDTLGKKIIQSIINEMKLEFPLSENKSFDQFFSEREYDEKQLVLHWKIQ